jgi:hypothetical protein
MSGIYFSRLSDSWKEEVVNVETHQVYKNIKWQNYQRTKEEVESIQVRHYNSKNGYSLDHPYHFTRNGAIDSQTSVFGSSCSSSSSSAQNQKEIRDMVWPTDIFGNKPICCQPQTSITRNGSPLLQQS